MAGNVYGEPGSGDSTSTGIVFVLNDKGRGEVSGLRGNIMKGIRYARWMTQNHRWLRRGLQGFYSTGREGVEHLAPS